MLTDIVFAFLQYVFSQWLLYGTYNKLMLSWQPEWVLLLWHRKWTKPTSHDPKGKAATLEWPVSYLLFVLLSDLEDLSRSPPSSRGLDQPPEAWCAHHDTSVLEIHANSQSVEREGKCNRCHSVCDIFKCTENSTHHCPLAYSLTHEPLFKCLHH